MHNYSSRFKLENGKWAYIQLDDFAKDAGRHIQRIRRLWQPPDHFFHFRDGGHVAAIRQHRHNSWYGKVDLSNFFDHITRHRITRCLKRIGYSFRDAEEFAVASTVCVSHLPRRFALPYGFTQSPLLASIVFDKSELGNCCSRLKSSGINLTVYVDDIIVSGNGDAAVGAALLELRKAARTSNFPINTVKSMGPSQALCVFNIDVSTQEMNVSNKRYSQMCQKIFEGGSGQASDGVLGYVRSVNPKQADRMRAEFPRIFEDG